MPGRSSPSRTLQFVGAITAVVALIGYIVFGWRFGDTGASLPFLLGALCVVIAVGWELSRRP